MSSIELDLPLLPSLGLTSLSFSPFSSSSLLVSSWDRSAVVTCYEVGERERQAQRRLVLPHAAAALDCCWSEKEEGRGFSGTIDGAVNSLDLSTGLVTQIGSHSAGTKCVSHSSSLNLLFSGGWDGVLSTWDVRASSSSHRSASSSSLAAALAASSRSSASTSSSSLPKVYSLSLSSTHAIVATSTRHLFLYDFRNLSQPLQIRESSLAHQTRCVKMMKNGQNGFAISSIEGRVAVEYFDQPSSSASSTFAFKCHRFPHSDGIHSVVSPVHALAFHPIHGTLVTGGGDGMVNIWDVANKKRICQYTSYHQSIAALDFNRSGNLLAIAVSEVEDQPNGGNEMEKSKERVVIRKVMENEVKPKSRTAVATPAQ